MFVVCVEKDSQVIIKKEIERSICRVGRSPFSDVFLDLPFISYEHLIIIEVLGNYFLIDRGLNNVFVNGHCIKKNVPVIIREGEKIKIGGILLIILPCDKVDKRDTMLLFENMQKGLLINNIIIVSNCKDVVKTFSDNEFDLGKLVRGSIVSEVLKNEIMRILKVETKYEVKFIILIKGSKHFNQLIEKKRERLCSKFAFIILTSLFVTFLSSIAFLIWVVVN